MYLVKDIGGAIALMGVSLVLLGTWPVVLAVLERRGRLPQHTYLDYSITNFLAALLVAFTFGQIGADTPETPNFLTQLTQDNWPSILFAMSGGVFNGLGTLATQYGWAFVGLSVTEVMASSLKVVIGTTLNYFLDGRINKAEILFPGVGCFLIAACLGSLVHSSNAADNQEKLSSAMVNHSNTNGDTENEELTKHLLEIEQPKDCEEQEPEVAPAAQAVEKLEAGTADFLVDLEGKRSIKVLGSNTFLGLGIVTFAGVSYSLFSPAFNLATNDQWHTLKGGVPHMVVYTAFFYFSLACFAIGIALNIWFLYHPMVGVPRSSLTAYLRDWKGRDLALVAGMVCGLGNAFQFMAGQAAGYAAADAVQALPLVSTVWGIVLFGEYRRSSRRTYTLLGSMLFMFVVAMVILMASSAHRRPL
uniref:Ureide permease 1-like n=2 Tax=Oryza nivara TaxID=4536 RepID=A0A0E0JAQ5_ORYNI